MPTRIDSSALQRMQWTLPDSANSCSGGKVHYHGHRVSDPETREKLDALARAVGRPVHVTSGDRTSADQERLLRQGYRVAKNSQHLHGKAADIYVEGMTPSELAAAARRIGFNGIGLYRDGHVHVDTRPRPARWAV